MLTKFALLPAAFLLVAGALAGPWQTSAPDCTLAGKLSGGCPQAEVGESTVELGATREEPASGGSEGGTGDAEGTYYESAVEPIVNLRCGEGVPLGCKVIGTPPPKATDATGPLSITDIAAFRPQPPTAGMQPNQWMIVGLDTNFYANTSAHTVDGTLFGDTAQVRFTPIAYGWDYGDGTTASLGTPGKTWAKNKIAEFDPTPTSHVFEESGNYTITLAVTYAAEYRVAGSSWQNVVGTLTIVAPPLTATAGHATTVLVDQDCIANPAGIGC
ncbi:PKD domain-containing protein [Salinibacterium sp. SWN139]|uniref:PKD domain-containing protein n=1 Tax=Salinibacterium sp. SWN139 TaxID=2792055 RepID=UPI001E572111|nr:PKD domain-containing protein [Salinibacterium sp. SWN139]